MLKYNNYGANTEERVKKNIFDSENQPSNRRGKSYKNLLLEVIRKESMIGLTKASTKEEAEKAFISHVAERAFNADDMASSTLLNSMLSKTYASLKSTMPEYEFEFDVSATPMVQAQQILKAASEGVIPPDVAAIFTQCIRNVLDIEVNTDIKERLDKLENLINGN